MTVSDGSAVGRLVCVLLGLTLLSGCPWRTGKCSPGPTTRWMATVERVELADGYGTVVTRKGRSLMVRPEFATLFQLILAAVLLLVLGQSIANKTGGEPRGGRKETSIWLLLLLFSWLGAHMGFVQVATGLVSIFILSMVHSRDLVRINSAKMVFVLVSATTSNVTLAIQSKITWEPALILAAGAGVGSFLASRWSVKKGHGAVRIVVIGICVAVLARLAFRIFG